MTPGASQNSFFTFEGIDASGKTLQAQILSSRLRKESYDVLSVRDPGGVPIAERIRDILLDRNHLGMAAFTELFLYEAARAQLVSEVILPALEQGRIILCDRFTDSTVAYQGYGRALPLDFIEASNTLACNGLSPARTYILDIPWEESIKRRSIAPAEDDRMESEKELFYNNVRKAYHILAEREKTRIVLLDGVRDAEEIADKIYKDAKHLLNRSHG